MTDKTVTPNANAPNANTQNANTRKMWNYTPPLPITQAPYVERP